MSVWSNLKFNTMPLVRSTISSFHYSNRLFESPDLKYKNRRPVTIFVHIAKRIAMQSIEQEVRKLATKWLNNWALSQKNRGERIADESGMKASTLRKQKRLAALIENQQVLSKNERAGKLRLIDINYPVIAMNKYGDEVPEAMILYYDNENEKLTFTGYKYDKESQKLQTDKTIQYTTKTWFHIDLAPEINFQSTKNIILTQVQGRDYSRKELVSGGDIVITVNGNIVSNEPGVYPSEAVKKFVKMMQHNGIINVNSFQFNQLNIDRIVIQDFRLGTPTYKNIQPYSFNCVAIEPDEDITVINDTIAQVNDIIQERVQTRSLDLVSILKQKSVELASEAAVQSVGMALDALTSNI